MTETGLAFAGACFLVFGFVALFILLKLPTHARRVFTHASSALVILGDPTLSDDCKERALQRLALGLVGAFFILLFGGAATFVLPGGAVWLADRAGLLSFDTVLATTLSWQFLLGSTIFMALMAWIAVRFHPSRKTGLAAPPKTTESYSAMERALHMIAFASRPLQVSISRLEDRIGGARIAKTDAPLFIAGLPRAGTTLLLELFEHTGEFASHTYRAMPFLLMPLSWGRYMRFFGRGDVARERAHGDGMLVSVDSPEAFEEMLWMTFYPERYNRPVMGSWKPNAYPRFEVFFACHRDKIVYLHNRNLGASARRYVSKNNLNIARVSWLLDRIPDARVIMPFREPYQHAASLLRQHRNFTRMHDEDEFSKLYMRGIGHFDFGANLKPVNFGKWRTENPDLDPDTLTFWLSYWCATYHTLLGRTGDRAVLFDFDAMCAEHAPALARLASFANVTDHQALVRQGERVKAAKAHHLDLTDVPADLRARVDDVYQSLRKAAL